jgi:adenine C2-methylase RlmN of 23S rRNA A2503 and tRNA A37
MELLGKSKNELRDFCVSLGEPAYRGGQIYHALYAERKSSVREITNLPAALRERLAAEATITLPTLRPSKRCLCRATAAKPSASPRKPVALSTANSA